MSKICPNCQEVFDDSHAFCSNCGSRLIDNVDVNPAFNLGDANAISGGVSINQSKNITSHDTHYHTTTVQERVKSESELKLDATNQLRAKAEEIMSERGRIDSAAMNQLRPLSKQLGIDEETFNKACTTSSSKKQRGSHYRRRDVFLLANKAFCGYCGNTITSESGTSPSGTIRHYYKCSTKKRLHQPCECKNFKKEQLENLVVDKIKTAILQSRTMEIITEYLCTAYNLTVNEDNLLVNNEKELAKKQKEIDNALDAIISGITNDSLKQKLNRLEEEKRIL